MKRLLLSVIFFAVINFSLLAQDAVVSKPYWRSASEFIFSMGNVETPTGTVDPVLRFSGFFHFQEQLHYNFNKTLGCYTGIGIRNVGMINKLNDSIKIKQRVYSLGIPVAFKIGKLPDGFHIAAGAEAELFFHYKEKVFYDDEKFRRNKWFSDKVNLFNPSVFLEFQSKFGGYIRFKYYLLDFLRAENQQIKIYDQVYPYYPTESKLFYISIGTSIRQKKKTRKAKPAEPAQQTTQLF